MSEEQLSPDAQALLNDVRKLPENERESTLRLLLFSRQAVNVSIRESNKWEEVSRVNMQQLRKEWDLKYEHKRTNKTN